jgi:hypothetical protein
MLLSSAYSPLFAKVDSGKISSHGIEQLLSIGASSQINQLKTTISGAIEHTNKVLELEAVVVEEQSEPSFFKKGEEITYASASFYLLSLLFLFTYFEKRSSFEASLNHFFYVNKRFVLFQVFRL